MILPDHQPKFHLGNLYSLFLSPSSMPKRFSDKWKKKFNLVITKASGIQQMPEDKSRKPDAEEEKLIKYPQVN